MQPWRYLIPKEERDTVLRKIRQETSEAYGFDMEACPKRKVCIGKDCIGRSLPWKSETAKPYLEQLKKTHKIVNGEMFIDNCNTCTIRNSCTSPCIQINDFFNRTKSRQPSLVYKETLDNFEIQHSTEVGEGLLNKGLKIPWDALSEKRKQVVQLYVYKQRDFLQIANELDLTNQARVKYEFYAALTTISEYGVMRKFIADKTPVLKESQLEVLNLIYYENHSLTYAAKKLGISKQAIQQMIDRLKKKYNLKWTKYVYKKGNKLVYNVPELMK